MKLAVVSLRRQTIFALSSLWLVGVVSCAGSPTGDSIQQSLEADPQLQDRITSGSEETNGDSNPLGAIPSSTAVRNLPDDAAASDSNNNIGTATDSADPIPQPGDANFIGPAIPQDWVASTGLAQPTPSTAPSLTDIPEDLRPYVADWLALGQGPANFQPGQTINRGEYAAWLFTANNLFYADQAAKKIRPASTTSKQAFQDVPSAHPHYKAIQGLAEAGLIPSALTGNSTAVTFNPSAPLTRENLVLWKAPLDSRTPLPTATVDAVKATWGFQDAAEVEPLALRAVLADHQNGDFANILRAFGYTTLFQPKKGVTQAEAAAALWRFGSQTEGVSVPDLLKRSEPTTTQGPEPAGKTTPSE